MCVGEAPPFHSSLCAHARPVERDDLLAVGQARGQLAPDLERVGIAVEEEQRRSRAQAGHPQPPAVAVGLDGRREHQARSRWSCSAARSPEIAQKLTHWPGWVELPAR